MCYDWSGTGCAGALARLKVRATALPRPQIADVLDTAHLLLCNIGAFDAHYSESFDKLMCCGGHWAEFSTAENSGAKFTNSTLCNDKGRPISCAKIQHHTSCAGSSSKAVKVVGADISRLIFEASGGHHVVRIGTGELDTARLQIRVSWKTGIFQYGYQLENIFESVRVRE